MSSERTRNQERKRWVFFPVRIPIKGGISVYKVSVPLSSLSSQQRDLLTSTHPFPSPTSMPPLLNSLLATGLASDKPTGNAVLWECTVHVFVHLSRPTNDSDT